MYLLIIFSDTIRSTEVINKIREILKIKNLQGKTLSIYKGQRKGLLENGYEKIKTIDVTHQPYYTIVKMALHSLKL